MSDSGNQFRPRVVQESLRELTARSDNHNPHSPSEYPSNSLGNFRANVLNRIPRGKSCPGTCITYRVDWDILAFFEREGYEEPHHEAIVLAITITGSGSAGQVLTTKQYLEQTWPLTGLSTLELLQNILRSAKHEAKMTCTSPSPMHLYGYIKNQTLVVVASGLPEFVTDIGEQLAWLGAALHPLDHISDALSTLSFTVIPDVQTEVDAQTSAVNCSIRYTVEHDEVTSNDLPGQCWRHLFNNPVIVGGFPIPSRPKEITGQEIPLDMLVGLAGASYLSPFKSKILIKGDNTMLVPVARSEDCLVWHLLQTKDPTDRISYLEADNIGLSDLKMSQIPDYRHILGSCSDSVSIAGGTSVSGPSGSTASANQPEEPNMDRQTPLKESFRGKADTAKKFWGKLSSPK
ncbi:hypothetical protein F5Y08DRAFT_340210 [Xylaria arbuscula]|nr:hypothetical protein F5Y08DRAFT_340210 [Xylaria arbuscula]